MVFLNFSGEFLNFTGALNSAAKSDVHLALSTTDHRTAGFDDISSERDKSSTAHVLSGDAQVLNNERVPKNKANCDVDAGVVVHHFVGESEDAVLSGRHDRFSTGTRTGEFVEWEEGGSTCTVFGQPSNGVGGVLVRFHDYRGHACADGGGQRHLVGTVLGRTEFGHGSNDTLQLLVVSSGDNGAGTACKSFCAGFLLHLSLGQGESTFGFSQFDFNARAVFGQLGLGPLSLRQLTSEGFTVVLRSLLGHLLQADIQLAKCQADLLTLLLCFGQLVAD